MSGTAIRVRALEPRDIEDVAAIYSCPSVMANSASFIPYQSHAQLADRFFPTPAGTYFFAAEADGRAVGVLGLHGRTRPRTRHAASIGMAVHEDYQGRGVGTALMAAMVELADRWLNLHRVDLEVYTDNARAIHLYENYGFAIEGTLRDFVFRDGAYVDAYAMARLRP